MELLNWQPETCPLVPLIPSWEPVLFQLKMASYLSICIPFNKQCNTL